MGLRTETGPTLPSSQLTSQRLRWPGRLGNLGEKVAGTGEEGKSESP